MGLAPFFLMFGREAAKHTQLESENPRYHGTNELLLYKNLYKTQRGTNDQTKQRSSTQPK